MPHANLQLLASGKSSDFTIICQGVEFKVHKAIICPESSFFRAACTNDFKERHDNTLSLPEEDPEILARVLIWLYTRDVFRSSITKEIKETLAKLVPGGPTTERSKFETCVLVYFCAYRQGMESMKQDLARDVSSLISQEDMDGDFTAFIEKVYNDIPVKDDPLRTQATIETFKRLWDLNLLEELNIWEEQDISDDSDDDSDDDNNKDAAKRIGALIQANEPCAFDIAIDIIEELRMKCRKTDVIF